MDPESCWRHHAAPQEGPRSREASPEGGPPGGAGKAVAGPARARGGHEGPARYSQARRAGPQKRPGPPPCSPRAPASWAAHLSDGEAEAQGARAQSPARGRAGGAPTPVAWLPALRSVCQPCPGALVPRLQPPAGRLPSRTTGSEGLLIGVGCSSSPHGHRGRDAGHRTRCARRRPPGHFENGAEVSSARCWLGFAPQTPAELPSAAGPHL